MRLALLGAVRSTEVALRELVAGGNPPANVIALEHDRSQRHSDYVDMAYVASELDVPCRTIHSARTPEVAELICGVEADLLLVVGWSEILPVDIRQAAHHGTIGYHPSGLPHLRGRGVIPWTVLLGLETTAGTMFWLEEGVDDGDIAYQRGFKVDPQDTATTLYDKHMEALADMIRDLAQVSSPSDIPRKRQLGEPSYCAQRKPLDGLIDWTDSSGNIDRLIRASTRPYPGARGFTSKDGTEVVLWGSSPVEGDAYHGLPGQVVALDEGKALVTCGRGLLRLDDVADTEGSLVTLRVQDRFLPFPLALQRWVDLRPL